eukprot:80902-Pleurochrysis_carterae.AAC.2
MQTKSSNNVSTTTQYGLRRKRRTRRTRRRMRIPGAGDGGAGAGEADNDGDGGASARARAGESGACGARRARGACAPQAQTAEALA